MGNAWIWGWSNGFKIKELACTYNKNGYTYVTKFQLFMTQGVILRSEVPSSRAGYWRTRGCKLYYVPGSLLLEQNLCLSNTLKSRRLGKLGKYDPLPHSTTTREANRRFAMKSSQKLLSKFQTRGLAY
jgi:hypothetical protein